MSVIVLLPMPRCFVLLVWRTVFVPVPLRGHISCSFSFFCLLLPDKSGSVSFSSLSPVAGLGCRVIPYMQHDTSVLFFILGLLDLASAAITDTTSLFSLPQSWGTTQVQARRTGQLRCQGIEYHAQGTRTHLVPKKRRCNTTRLRETPIAHNLRTTGLSHHAQTRTNCCESASNRRHLSLFRTYDHTHKRGRLITRCLTHRAVTRTRITRQL